MKLQKRETNMVRQTDKNGDKKRQFPERHIPTAL